MKFLFLAIALSAIVLFHHVNARLSLRRPLCVCTRRVAAMMQDSTGAYCVQFNNGKINQWLCENEEEWRRYFEMLAKTRREPRCVCSGDVTKIMEDLTGTYCVYTSEFRKDRWECENRDDWELYRESLRKENRY